MPVFSLEEVKALQVKNISQENLKYFSEQPIFGYVIGGYAPPASTQQTTLIKTSLSDETSLVSTTSLGTRSNISASFNNQYAYYNRGFPQANGCYLNRLDFSSDVASEYSSTSFLGPSRFNLSAVSGNNYGWFGGGAIQPVPWVVYSTIARVDFSTAVMSLPGVNLPPASAPAGTPTVAGRSRASVVSNAIYGYFAGGSIANPARTFTNLITRMDLSVETFNNPGKNVPTGRDSMIGVSAPLYGYFGGGADSPNSATISSLLSMDFSNETITTKTPLPAIRGFASTNGISNFFYGYFAGGLSQDSTDNHLSTTDRIDFSNETVSSSFNLPIARSQFAAAQGGQSALAGRGTNTYGYFGGGYQIPATTINTITRLDFSNEVQTNLSSASQLIQSSNSHGIASNFYYAYFIGGEVSALDISTVQRFDFSSEVTTLPGRNLPTSLTASASINSNSYGYVCGGSPGVSYSNIIRRLDFSNETFTIPPVRMPERKATFSGMSNSSYGYMAGGFFNPPPVRISTITKLDFSTENITTLPQTLPDGTNNNSASSSNRYGYFFGGLSTPGAIICTVTRIDFSTDNVSTLTAGLPTIRRNTTTSSNNFYSYIAGGQSVPTISLNTITRLDFSNESFTNLPVGLPSGRHDARGVSNSK